jgi:transcriptional antiterminator RfaH
MLDATATVALDDHNRGLSACGSASAAWAVCQTHPQAERWALANLQRQGFTAYLPMTVAFRRDRATPTLRHRISVPLWAGYLFVQPGTHWAPICSTHGVSRLLMAGPKPHMLANALVEAVRAAEAISASGILADVPWAPGTPCSLATGAFAGHPGVVVSVTRGIAHVALMLFGCVRDVTVNVDCLVARE